MTVTTYWHSQTHACIDLHTRSRDAQEANLPKIASR